MSYSLRRCAARCVHTLCICLLVFLLNSSPEQAMAAGQKPPAISPKRSAVDSRIPPTGTAPVHVSPGQARGASPVPNRVKSAAPVKAAVLPKPIPRSLLYGVNVAWSDASGVEDWDRDGGRHARQMLALLRLAGVTHTRIPVRWADVERARGRYDWSPLDRLISQLRTQGVAVTGVVRSAPDWAIESTPAARRLFAQDGLSARMNDQPPAANSYGDWTRFAAALGAHFKGAVEHWEVGYRPDSGGMPILEHSASGGSMAVRMSGDAAVYTRLLNLFAQNVKRTDPGCTVAVGALAGPKTDFLQAIYGNGGKAAFDAVAVCSTGGTDGLDVAWLDACRQVLVARGDTAKNLWLAEWGWNSYPEAPDGLQPGLQARLLRAGLMAMRRRTFIQSADWKLLADVQGHVADNFGEAGAGLCTGSLQSKPAFVVFQKEAMPGLTTNKAPPRTLLVAGVRPDAAESGAAHIDLDASLVSGAAPTAWLGVHASQPFPVQWDAIGRTLKSNSASWIRLNLFRSGWIRRTEDTGWSADYVGLDRLLHGLAAANISVVLQTSVVPGMSTGERMAILRGLAQRYGAGYSVFRWEFAGQDGGSLSEYEAFAQTVGAVVPERPIGFASTGPDPVRDVEAVARLCTQKRCPLNSFSWLVEGNPIEASRLIRGIRDVLTRYPALKGTMLMPSMAESASGAAGLSLAQRLIDYCPLEQPHGLLGILAPLGESAGADGDLTWNGKLLSLLNRLRGVRLNAYGDIAGLRCLAAKNGDVIQLLLWREDRAAAPLSWILRLHGLAGAGGARIEQISLSADGRNAGDVPTARGAEASVLAPDAVADIHTQAGEAEVFLGLDSGAVSLVTIRLRRPPPIELSLTVPRGQWFAGELMDLDCEVRNMSRATQNVDVELLPGAKSATNALKASLGALPAGATRRVRFRAHAARARAGQAFINVRATGDLRSSLSVRIVPPVAATLAAPRYDVDAAGIAKVRVMLVNRSQAPLVLGIRMAGRADALARDFTLPPGGKPIEQVVSVSPPSKDPGCYPVELIIEGAEGPVAALSPLIGVPLECRYAALKPTIDGNLSEWTDSDPIGMGRADQVHEKTWQGPTDLSAYAYLRWDEQFLYVACAVTDDVFFAPYAPPEMLKGDSVQFAFSSDRRIPAAQSGYGPGDHAFGMALLDGVHPVLYRFAGPAEAGTGVLKRGAVAVRRSGTQNFYEAAIPWSELGPARAKENALFGFSIRVNDNDGQGRGYIAWGEGLGRDVRPLMFPPIKLVR